MNTICPADPYNIITIFDALSRFYIDIETQLDIEQCRLHTYLHTFAMDSFIERARTDIEQQLGETTLSKEIWATQTVPSHNVVIKSIYLAFKGNNFFFLLTKKANLENTQQLCENFFIM